MSPHDHRHNQGRGCPECLEASQACVLWLIAPVLSVLRWLRMLPARLDLEWHRWAEREMHPLHPEKPHVVRRIAELEEKCRA